MTRWKGLGLALVTVCTLEAHAASGSAKKNLAATRAWYADHLEDASSAALAWFTHAMPKGGDLHHHYAGAIYAETYLDWAKAQGFCAWRVTDPALGAERFKLATKPTELTPEARAVCADIDAARLDEPFYRALLTRWSDKDYGSYENPLPPDQQFFTTFEYFDTVSGVDYAQGLKGLRERALAENVSYLETMVKGGPSVEVAGLDELFAPLGATSSDAEIDAAFEKAFALLAADAGVSAKVDGYVTLLDGLAAGASDEAFRVRFQSYVPRNMPPAKTFARLYTSFAGEAKSDAIVGVNFVGPENRYVAMRDYALHMKMFAFLSRKFPGAKLSLHAGELVPGMVPPEGLRSHIREAVEVAGAARVGHGIDVAWEDDAPALLATMRERGVAVEVNLTSNDFILGVRGDAHPVVLYREFGVPFVLSTDDPGVSRNSLSDEYLRYVTTYQPTYDELKDVAYASVRYAFLSDADKAAVTADLDRRFAAFEAEVAGLAP